MTLNATERKDKLNIPQKANEAQSSASKTEMAFRGVRSSKFRHVFGLPSKKESCFEGVRITKNAHDSNFCAVNPKYVAVVVESAGGGSFIVLAIDKTGRIDINTPKVCGHRGQVLDIKWDPFDDDVIASASEDTTIKIWRIPSGGLTTNLSEFTHDLRRHSRRVAFIEWHPTAEHVLASAGYDYKIILWKTMSAAPLTIISCHPDTIYSFSFNRDGTQIATTCKDKIIRVIDARSGEVLEEGPGHQGPKSSKVAFLGNLNKLFTTGFSRGSDRQYAVWDANDLSKPLKMDAVDCSSGVLFPFYDHDTRVVFVAGKGDGNIRYYEIVDEKPYCHYLSEFKSSAPQRGLGFMPKRGVDPAKCEIMRFFKLYATKDFVEPISMIVPRKSEAFQDDLYPDCPGMIPSLTADEWKSGQSREPILSSMRDKERNAVQFSRGDEGIISPPHNAPDPHLPPSDRASSVISGYGVQQQQQQQQHQQQPQQQHQSSLHRFHSESHRIPGSIMNIAKNSASEAVVKIPSARFNDNGNRFDNASGINASIATSTTNVSSGGGGPNCAGKNNNNAAAVRPGLDRANTIIGTTPTNLTQRNKQWSALGSPTNGQPSWENIIPKTDSELRRAYFKLQDEVRDLKEQLSLKDRRILELENQLSQRHLTASEEANSPALKSLSTTASSPSCASSSKTSSSSPSSKSTPQHSDATIPPSTASSQPFVEASHFEAKSSPMTLAILPASVRTSTSAPNTSIPHRDRLGTDSTIPQSPSIAPNPMRSDRCHGKSHASTPEPNVLGPNPPQSLSSLSPSPDQILMRPSSSSSSSSSFELFKEGSPPPLPSSSHPSIEQNLLDGTSNRVNLFTSSPHPPIPPPPPTPPTSITPSAFSSDETLSFPKTTRKSAYMQEHLPESLVDGTPTPPPFPPPQATEELTTNAKRSISQNRSSASSSSSSALATASTVDCAALRKETLPLQHLVLFDAVEDESVVDEDRGFQVEEDHQGVFIRKNDSSEALPSTTSITTITTTTTTTAAETTTMTTSKRIRLTSDLSLPRDYDKDATSEELQRTNDTGESDHSRDLSSTGTGGSVGGGEERERGFRHDEKMVDDGGFDGGTEELDVDLDPLTKLVIVTPASTEATATSGAATTGAAAEVLEVASRTSNSSLEVTLLPQTASSDC